jgi:hypothetical protein
LYIKGVARNNKPSTRSDKMKTLEKIKVRECSIRNIQHPEYGTFGVMEDNGEYFSIYNHGMTIVFKSEINKFWEVV